MIKLPKYKNFDNQTQTLSFQSKTKHFPYEQITDGSDRDRLLIDDASELSGFQRINSVAFSCSAARL